MPRLRLTLVSPFHAYDAQSPAGIGATAPPLGVLTLAAVLREAFDVSLVDLDHVWRGSGGCTETFRETVVQAIVCSAPQVLGFSSISGSYPTTIRLASAAPYGFHG